MYMMYSELWTTLYQYLARAYEMGSPANIVASAVAPTYSYCPSLVIQLQTVMLQDAHGFCHDDIDVTATFCKSH